MRLLTRTVFALAFGAAAWYMLVHDHPGWSLATLTTGACFAMARDPAPQAQQVSDLVDAALAEYADEAEYADAPTEEPPATWPPN